MPHLSSLPARPSAAFRLAAPICALVLAQPLLSGLGGQEPLPRPRGHPVEVDSLLEKPHALRPESGPPGTQVHVEVDLLPAVTPLWVGIGAPRMGFEALAFVLSSPQGELRHEVSVPGWAGRDRSHRFIVFDAYFRPLAMTRPFHVTAQDGTLLRQGAVGEARGACVTLEDQDGILYGLLASNGLTAGEEVIVEGRLVQEASPCGELPTIRVERSYRRTAGG